MVGLVVVLVLVVGAIGCDAVDTDIKPYADDTYDIGSDDYRFRDIFISGSLDREKSDGTGGYWHEYNVGTISAAHGASGASLIVPNVSTLGGWRLDGIAEVLYWTTHVEGDWDQVSNAIVEVTFEVNVDNTGGADADTVQFQLECWHKIKGELTNIVHSHAGSTTVGKSDQHELFVQTINIGTTRVDETISHRLNLNTIFSEVDNVIVNYIEFKYRTRHPAAEVD